jgi:hypothetical protein
MYNALYTTYSSLYNVSCSQDVPAGVKDVQIKGNVQRDLIGAEGAPGDRYSFKYIGAGSSF